MALSLAPFFGVEPFAGPDPTPLVGVMKIYCRYLNRRMAAPASRRARARNFYRNIGGEIILVMLRSCLEFLPRLTDFTRS